LKGVDSGSASVAASAAAGGAGRAGTGAGADRLAQAVFALLVVACFAAFVVTQRLKHTPTAVQNFEMNTAFQPSRVPAAACRGRVPVGLVNATKRIEYLSFKLAQADKATVAIVDSAGDEVATIVRDIPAERYKQLSLCWNGHRGPAQRGELAPPGEYRLQVHLHDQDLTKYSTRSFTLEGIAG
jgi:hypothetical protein